MESHPVTAQRTLPQPSWTGVRSIYRKLSDEFHVLTDAYDLILDEETRISLDHLIIAIDDVDHCIDDQPQKLKRDHITTALLDFLSNDVEKWKHPDTPSAFSIRIENLKHIVQIKAIQGPFTKAAETIFRNTEIKRHTDQTEELIAYVKEEGRATAMLPLSVLGIDPESQFGIFFTRLCMIMGIADLVFDARDDYRNGLIKVKPSFKLYLRLVSIVTLEGIKMIISFPKKLQFLVYCLKFTRELLRE